MLSRLFSTKDSDAKFIDDSMNIIAFFIFFISIAYILAVVGALVPPFNLAGLFILSSVLPYTFFGGFFGNPPYDVFMLLFIVFILSCFAFWSATEIKKRKLRGLLVYAAINGILIFGIILDLLFLKPKHKPGAFGSDWPFSMMSSYRMEDSSILFFTTFFIFLLYILTLIILWVQRRKFS